MSNRIVGTWNGKLADKIDGHVYVRIGVDGSWYRVVDGGNFEPLSQAEANEPKNRNGLTKVGGPYVRRFG